MEKLPNWLLIFFIPFFIFATLGYIYLDCKDVAPCDDAFLSRKTDQLFLNYSLISTVFLQLNPITSFILTDKNSVRAPPF